MFEIIVENIKFELDKILKANESYKTDYYTCNRKKFLLANFYNANSEFEQNAYMNELVRMNEWIEISFKEDRGED